MNYCRNCPYAIYHESKDIYPGYFSCELDEED